MSSDLPVLLDVTRNGLVESHHRGSLVLLDATGRVEVSLGDAPRPFYPRSALKPLQAIAMVEAGFDGRGGSLALAAASHEGEPVHLEGARSILAAAGLDERSLQCPAELPTNHAAMLAHLAAGGRPSRLCHNCSGKHAAMVATCVGQGWDVASYLARSHPLQAAIRHTVTAYAGEPIAITGVDGCGAPAHVLTLTGLARAFGAVASAGSGAAQAVRDAMQAHPQLIGGTGRAVSELTASVEGLLCKDGAEGVWGAGLADGRAFAVKVDDGATRALPPLLAAALRFWGIDDATVRAWSAVDTLGGVLPVGSIGWAPELVSALGL